MNQVLHHGIIYGYNEPILRKSCIIFSNRFCIAPASLLLNSFEQIRNEIKTKTDYDIQRELKANRIIDTRTDQRCYNLSTYKFKVVHEQYNEVLFESDATIVNLFKCRNIWNSFNDILRNFVVRSKQNDKNDLHKLLLSSFVVLRLEAVKGKGHEISSLEMFNDIFKKTARYGHHKHWSNFHVRKLENIESVSTPFGNECFLNTINSGRIANIFGDNKCLMVASMPLVNGCEGGAVYSKGQNLIGIVISTTFDWNSENATLTLVAKFDEIMAEFVEQCKLTSINIEDEYEHLQCTKYISDTKLNCKSLTCAKESFSFENFIVLIQSTENWGSGCFVKINDMRMIITCAHVLENHDGNVRCTWKFGHFESKIIFKNPHFDEAFDIAILGTKLFISIYYKIFHLPIVLLYP